MVGWDILDLEVLYVDVSAARILNVVDMVRGTRNGLSSN